MPELFAYTDGACSGNPGPGGWGVVLIAKQGQNTLKTREFYSGAAQTTNNRMELTAALEALKALKHPSTITIVTDSTYLKEGITKWIYGWKAKNWQKKGGLKNADLWQALDAARNQHNVSWQWVKAHAGHEYNERADALARQGMASYKG